MYLLVEHGRPKAARLFADESHMGGAQAIGVIVEWVKQRLTA
jgi:hypothetical protein